MTSVCASLVFHDDIAYIQNVKKVTLFCFALILISSLSARNTSLGTGFQVTSVWNHAYQENWNTDSLEDILAGARDAYVLLDAFDDPDARAAIPAIKAKSNIIGVYISVGTGEDWRDDFNRLEPYLVERHWGDWPGEYFIDRIGDEVLAVMI